MKCRALLYPTPAEEQIGQDSCHMDLGLSAGLNGCLVSSKACDQELATKLHSFDLRSFKQFDHAH